MAQPALESALNRIITDLRSRFEGLPSACLLACIQDELLTSKQN